MVLYSSERSSSGPEMISGVRASSIRIEVHLVDDGVVVPALHHFGRRVFHVVAQIVEAELVVGAVGDVAAILLAPKLVGEIVHDDADGQSEEFIDGAHPRRIAFGEIVVDGDDVDALAGQRVEIDGQGGDQRLAFAGLHFGDAAFMQHHAADHLHVEMALAQGALGRLAHGGERFRDQIIERGAGLHASAEVLGAGAQLRVGERGDLRLERVDLRDHRAVFLEFPLVGGAEDFAGEGAKREHWVLSLRSAGGSVPDPRQSLRKASKNAGEQTLVRHKRAAQPCQRDGTSVAALSVQGMARSEMP